MNFAFFEFKTKKKWNHSSKGIGEQRLFDYKSFFENIFRVRYSLKNLIKSWGEKKKARRQQNRIKMEQTRPFKYSIKLGGCVAWRENKPTK